jgi:signal transduction histidine kinase
VEAAIGLLVSTGPLRWASVWARDARGEIKCVCSAGESYSSRGARQLACDLLAGSRTDDGRRRQLLGVALRGRERPLGAIVGRASAGEQERCRAMVIEGAATLHAALERDISSADLVARERAQLQSSERKLTRLGLDLHDGPIQELAALATDVRLFADQLNVVLGDSAEHDLLRGRTEDLDAQLVALDHGLRRISGEVQPGQIALRRQLRLALAELVRGFAERTGVTPRLTLSGPLGALSDSQQIALLNIVAEALSNIRRHAGARTVQVAVKARREGVEATISDDGRGFDVNVRPKRAGREGRKGLLAIKERVRLLGGRCVIESRRGGPTHVRVVLPRWRPTPARAARRPRQAAASTTARNGASSFSKA